MQIGSLTLRSNLCLAPLAGYTNLPFRLVVRELGGVGLCTTDLVNARSLLEKRAKAFKLIETRPADSPLAVQLFGSVPAEMRDAALLLEARGVAAVDINMGCPVRKVCQVGAGSALMTDFAQTAALAKAMVDAVKIPVTAKMRLGWDDANITAPDLARALEDVGVAAIFVHGRTREQGFGGRVNLAGICAVVQAVKRIPVIGNGDVTTPQAAKQMLEETGCAGVSIGRGAFYDPWIFKRTAHYLTTAVSRRQTGQPPSMNSHLLQVGTRSTRVPDSRKENGDADGTRPYQLQGGNARNLRENLSSSDADRAFRPGEEMLDGELLPEPSFEERVGVMCRHLDLMVEVFGEELGCRMFRKVAPWYARRFGPCHEFNRRVVRLSRRAQFDDILADYRHYRQQFLDANGELLPRFRPAPLAASFMREPGGTPQAGHFPVPKGPMDVW